MRRRSAADVARSPATTRSAGPTTASPIGQSPTSPPPISTPSRRRSGRARRRSSPNSTTTPHAIRADFVTAWPQFRRRSAHTPAALRLVSVLNRSICYVSLTTYCSAFRAVNRLHRLPRKQPPRASHVREEDSPERRNLSHPATQEILNIP